MKTIQVALPGRAYPIYIGRGILRTLASVVQLANRRVLVLTDENIPDDYVHIVAGQCTSAHILTLSAGERTKCMAQLERVLLHMAQAGLTRGDLLIAVGGGVIGDLGGLAASLYMRGIDYVGVPTSTLAQTDSSVGGKTAIDLGGIKNIVGTFYQPRAVLIDPDTLFTLPMREYANGLAEALKMGLIADPKLFALLETGDVIQNIEEILYRAVSAKAGVVMRDEKETGERMSLNFGHTLGHGIESAQELQGLLHGECVGLGMLCFIQDDTLRGRTARALENLHLPTQCVVEEEKVMNAVAHDKKGGAGGITCVLVQEMGKYKLEKMENERIRTRLSVVNRGEG